MPARGHKCCERLVNPVPNFWVILARSGKKRAGRQAPQRKPAAPVSYTHLITTPPPLTAPGNSEIFGAPASPFGGSLTGCALKTGCPSWRTRSPGARASIGTMGSGRKTGKGRFPIRTDCALLLICPLYTSQRDQLFYGRKVDVQDIPIQSHFPYISPGVGNAHLSHPFMDGCQLVRCYHDVQMDIPLAVLHQRSSSRPFRRSLGSFTSVSYTHLDVYKRQPHRQSKRYHHCCWYLP